MWELDYKESWVLKNWCFWTVVLEKTLDSPMDCKEIQPVHPKGDQSWVFFGRPDVEAETPILWPPDAKSWLIWKDPDAGRDWRQEEKGTTEDEMVGWHHWLNGHGFGWTPGVDDGQGGLACCSSWGHKVSDTTEWTELKSLQLYPTLCDPSGSSVHGILQARIPDWVAIPSSRELPNPGMDLRSPMSSALAGRLFFSFLPLAPPGKPLYLAKMNTRSYTHNRVSLPPYRLLIFFPLHFRNTNCMVPLDVIHSNIVASLVLYSF